MRRIVTGLALVLTIGVSQASAAPLNITDIVGSWLAGSVVPPGGADITNSADQGTDSISWPAGATAQSGLDFTPSGDILGAPIGSPILLGTLVHRNFPTSATITNVDYSFAFGTNGVPAILADTFSFVINDTPNVADCGFPSVSNCDDFVTVSSVALNSPIVVGTDTYFFNLIGFSQNGGASVSTVFQTLENTANTAGLYGLVTTSPIPEPASLVLLGTGLLGLAAARRRRARR